MSAWDLYDDLIDAIPRDIVVSRAAQGPRWTRVYTESPSCGMAMTMSATSRPAQMRAEYSGFLFAPSPSWPRAGIFRRLPSAWLR